MPSSYTHLPGCLMQPRIRGDHPPRDHLIQVYHPGVRLSIPRAGAELCCIPDGHRSMWLIAVPRATNSWCGGSLTSRAAISRCGFLQLTGQPPVAVAHCCFPSSNQPARIPATYRAATGRCGSRQHPGQPPVCTAPAPDGSAARDNVRGSHHMAIVPPRTLWPPLRDSRPGCGKGTSADPALPHLSYTIPCSYLASFREPAPERSEGIPSRAGHPCCSAMHFPLPDTFITVT